MAKYDAATVTENREIQAKIDALTDAINKQSETIQQLADYVKRMVRKSRQIY